MKDKPQQLVGLTHLVAAFHLNERQLRNLIIAKTLPQAVSKSGRKPLYDYWLMHHAFIDYMSGKGGLSSIAKKQEEKLDKQNLKLDMANKVAMGELVVALDIEHKLIDLFGDIKTRIRAIPTKTAQEIASLKSAKKTKRELVACIKGVLSVECDEALEELSEWGK